MHCDVLAGVASLASRLEAQDARGCRSISSRNLIKVLFTRLESAQSDLVEKLRALGRVDHAARGGAVVGVGRAVGPLVELVVLCTVQDFGCSSDSKGSLEVDVDSGGQVRKGNHVDIVRWGGVLRRDRRGLDEADKPLAVTIDGLVNATVENRSNVAAKARHGKTLLGDGYRRAGLRLQVNYTAVLGVDR